MSEEMKRREFIKLASAMLPLAFIRVNADDMSEINKNLMESAVKKFHELNLFDKSFTEAVGEIGRFFVGTPYVGWTLEGEGPEKCRIFLDKFDCVTFYEAMLGIVRTIYHGNPTMSGLYDEVTYMRYRGGVLDGYLSRLHYSSDWIIDNVKKGVVEDITESLGGVQFSPNVYFMSKNPKYYPALKNNPKLTQKMKKIEDEINKHKMWYIPKNQIAKQEKNIQTGDIIMITSSVPGLDYAHTALAYQKNGYAHLLHASSAKKKVVLDSRISSYLARNRKQTGITVLRPQKVG